MTPAGCCSRYAANFVLYYNNNTIFSESKNDLKVILFMSERDSSGQQDIVCLVYYEDETRVAIALGS